MLKQTRVLLMLLFASMFLLLGCGAPAGANTPTREDDIVAVTFDFQKQSGYASNQFAVWVENANGKLVKTLYVTQFTVNGGYEKRPDAIPVWVKQSGLAQGIAQDAVSGATPKSGSLRYVWDLTDQSGRVCRAAPIPIMLRERCAGRITCCFPARLHSTERP